MKLKPLKEKNSIADVFKTCFSKTDKSSSSSVNIDVDGGVTLENFKKIIEYTDKKIAIETKYKTVYIYGDNLYISHCDRHFAEAGGDILKIELFSKEGYQCTAE